MTRPRPTVWVLGLGTAGTILASRFATHGMHVVGIEPDATALAVARERIAEVLRSSGQDPDAVEYAPVPDHAPVADLVVEAVPEEFATKVAALQHAAGFAGPDAVLATTTTGFSVTAVAARCGRMTRTVGLHIGPPGPDGPAPVVELVSTPVTDHPTRIAVRELLGTAGYTPVPVDDTPGFLGGALLLGYLNDAASMHAEGYASAAAIDTAMTVLCDLPVGPLAQLDLIGIDSAVASLAALAERTGDPAYLPAAGLARMVDAGLLGRKAGRGFHRYDAPARNGTADRADADAFIADALLFRYLNQAVTMLEEHAVEPETVDEVMTGACGFPLGPFRLLDTVGLDVSLTMGKRLHAVSSRPCPTPARYLAGMAKAGLTGVRAGRGFYRYA